MNLKNVLIKKTVNNMTNMTNQVNNFVYVLIKNPVQNIIITQR